jgi:glycosyltransferase involved in cell wall biosynthesis
LILDRDVNTVIIIYLLGPDGICSGVEADIKIPDKMKAFLTCIYILSFIILCYGNILPPIIFMSHIGCDFSGFFAEIMGFIQGMEKYTSNVYLDIGKCSSTFLDKLEPAESLMISKAQYNYLHNPPNINESIVVQHKLPGAKFSEIFAVSSDSRPLYGIGRMMTEAATISRTEISYTKIVDEVWVPTVFHKAIFEAYGMLESKVFVIPEAVNSLFFKSLQRTNVKDPSITFRFVSVFKLERRKGWDVLLKAYWRAFSSFDNVELVIRSYKPGWERGPSDLYHTFNALAKAEFKVPMASLAKVIWIQEELDRRQLRDFYHSADAFVLPTRGEGWCLPCVEAMASGLPVIVSNFSGPTEYMNEVWSYPLKIAENLNTDGTAEPSVDHLVELMRRVEREREEAARKGQAAMRHVGETYSPVAVGRVLFDHLLKRIAIITREYETIESKDISVHELQAEL